MRQNRSHLSFYQVVKIPTEENNQYAPPYIVAPKRLLDETASSCVTKICAVIRCFVHVDLETPLSEEYGTPKRMTNIAAIILGAGDPSKPLVCRSIERVFGRYTKIKKTPDSAYIRLAGLEPTAPLSSGDGDDDGDGDGDDDGEEDEEEESCSAPIDDDDQIHMHYRFACHPATLFSSEQAPQCYPLQQRLARAGIRAGIQLPLRATRPREISEPRLSPAWTVEQILSTHVASAADIVGVHENEYTPSGFMAPLRCITVLIYSAIAHGLNLGEDVGRVAEYLRRATGAQNTDSPISSNAILKLCAAVEQKNIRLNKTQTNMAMHMLPELFNATQTVARGERFCRLTCLQPASVLEMLSERQLRAYDLCLESKSISACLPTEMAAAFSHVVYFRPLLLQRLAYALALPFLEAACLGDAEQYAVTACRRLANEAWYGSGSTVSISESRSSEDEETIFIEAEEHLAVYEQTSYALPSTALYCAEIVGGLEASEEATVFTYANATACIVRLGEELQKAAEERSSKALQSASAARKALLLTHSYAAASEVRAKLGNRALAAVVVMPYTMLVTRPDIAAKRSVAGRFSSAILFRAELFGDSELHAVLDALRRPADDARLPPLAFLYNHLVQRPRRFFGTGAPLYHLFTAFKEGAAVALHHVDWERETAAAPGCDRSGAAVLLRALWTETQSSLDEFHSKLPKSRLFATDAVAVRRFIAKHGRDVQLFSLGLRSTFSCGRPGAKRAPLLGHALRPLLLRKGVETWCRLYGSGVARAETNTSSEATVGQRVYLEDIGQVAYVKQIGLEDPSGTVPMVPRIDQTMPIDFFQKKARFLLECSDANAVHAECSEVGYGCCKLRGAAGRPHPNVINPLRHHVVDGVCIDGEAYAGPSVQAAVVFCSRVNFRSLAAISAVVDKEILLVPVSGTLQQINNVICKRPARGFVPRSPMSMTVAQGSGA